MKILVPTYVFPNVKHIRTQIMNNILLALRNKVDTNIAWVIFQPDKFTSTNIQNTSLMDIHDFDDAVSLLRQINPDCIIITSTLDLIQYAFSIAAKYLHIPIFSIYVYSEKIIGNKDNRSVNESMELMVRSFLSNKTSTDSIEQQKFLRRGKFIVYKNKFLINTLRKTGINIFNSLMIPIKDILVNLSGKSKNYNELADYHLLPDQSWIPFLTQIGIDSKNIFVTGNPYWENLKTKNNLILKKQDNQNQIHLLIVTDSLFEHSYWSEQQRTKFITTLISELQKNSKINISFKIHPSSEDKQYYIKLSQEKFSLVKIFQSENLTSILDDFDLVISYGSSTAHTEIIASYMKMILFNLKLNMKPAPLLKEGILCGLVSICESFDELIPKIHELMNKDITISNTLIREYEKLFPGNKKSSDQIADIIIKKICK